MASSKESRRGGNIAKLSLGGGKNADAASSDKAISLPTVVVENAAAAEKVAASASVAALNACAAEPETSAEPTGPCEVFASSAANDAVRNLRQRLFLC